MGLGCSCWGKGVMYGEQAGTKSDERMKMWEFGVGINKMLTALTLRLAGRLGWSVMLGSILEQISWLDGYMAIWELGNLDSGRWKLSIHTQSLDIRSGVTSDYKEFMRLDLEVRKKAMKWMIYEREWLRLNQRKYKNIWQPGKELWVQKILSALTHGSRVCQIDRGYELMGILAWEAHWL